MVLALAQTDPDGARRMKETLDQATGEIAAAYGHPFPWFQLILVSVIAVVLVAEYVKWRKQCAR